MGLKGVGGKGGGKARARADSGNNDVYVPSQVLMPAAT